MACVGSPPCQEPDDADVDVPVTAEVHLALRGRNLPAADQTVLEAAAGQALLTLRQQRLTAQAKQAHLRQEAASLRTALLSAVRHDLRAPLTSITAEAAGLRADPAISTAVSTEAGGRLGAIEESVAQITALVDNLLDSSRISAGAAQAQLRPVGYDKVVARALAGVDGPVRRAINGEIEVEVEVDEHLRRVLADPRLLERVVAIVVDHAMRRSRAAMAVSAAGNGSRPGGRGEPAVAIRGSTYADQVELRIVDHGHGPSKKAIDSVFGPSEQRAGDQIIGPAGGLGLSVAKEFTEAMHGAITAEHTPGGGLTVVISLPADASTAAEPGDSDTP